MTSKELKKLKKLSDKVGDAMYEVIDFKDHKWKRVKGKAYNTHFECADYYLECAHYHLFEMVREHDEDFM